MNQLLEDLLLWLSNKKKINEIKQNRKYSESLSWSSRGQELSLDLRLWQCLPSTHWAGLWTTHSWGLSGPEGAVPWVNKVAKQEHRKPFLDWVWMLSERVTGQSAQTVSTQRTPQSQDGWNQCSQPIGGHLRCPKPSSILTTGPREVEMVLFALGHLWLESQSSTLLRFYETSTRLHRAIGCSCILLFRWEFLPLDYG